MAVCQRKYMQKAVPKIHSAVRVGKQNPCRRNLSGCSRYETGGQMSGWFLLVFLPEKPPHSSHQCYQLSLKMTFLPIIAYKQTFITDSWPAELRRCIKQYIASVRADRLFVQIIMPTATTTIS